MLTQEIVRELLDYDPTTGVLTWKPREQKWFKDLRSKAAWNAVHAGKTAGGIKTNKKTGYKNRVITLMRTEFQEHRVIWIWMKGLPIPKALDHKNRDATDNRWDNIRKSSHRKNNKNASKRVDNKSGITGVHWYKPYNKWAACVQVNGKRHLLGYFQDINQAGKAVSDFRKGHDFDPEHGKEVAHYRI